MNAIVLDGFPLDVNGGRANVPIRPAPLSSPLAGAAVAGGGAVAAETGLFAALSTQVVALGGGLLLLLWPSPLGDGTLKGDLAVTIPPPFGGYDQDSADFDKPDQTGVSGRDKAQQRLETIIGAQYIAQAIRRCGSCPANAGFPQNQDRMNDINTRYQHYICKRPISIISDKRVFIEEWNYATVSFDGFIQASCTLQETKGKYDQFFELLTADGREEVRRKSFFQGHLAIFAQALVQNGVVQASGEMLKLIWYFSQSLSYTYFSMMFSILAFYKITTQLVPYDEIFK